VSIGPRDKRLAEALALFDRRNALAREQWLDARRREAVRIAHHYDIEATLLLARLRNPCVVCGKGLNVDDARRVEERR